MPAHPAPTAIGAPAPTMPLAPKMFRLKSAACIDPPRPWLSPSSRPVSSAIMRAGSTPLASTWPWPRWVLVITSVSRSAAQTPVAMASCPMYGWIPPTISPDLTSSIAHSSKRRISRMVR